MAGNKSPVQNQYSLFNGMYSMSLEGFSETEEFLASLGNRMRPAFRKVLREQSLQLMEHIKARMPVETGRARAGWGIWRKKDMSYYSPTQRRIALPKAVNANGIYDVSIPVRQHAGMLGRAPVNTQEQFMKQFNAASPNDAIWIDKSRVPGSRTIPLLEIIQGTRLAYVQQLNEGSSRQAPAAFIDSEYQKAGKRMERAVSDEIRKLIA